MLRDVHGLLVLISGSVRSIDARQDRPWGARNGETLGQVTADKALLLTRHIDIDYFARHPVFVFWESSGAVRHGKQRLEAPVVTTREHKWAV